MFVNYSHLAFFTLFLFHQFLADKNAFGLSASLWNDLFAIVKDCLLIACVNNLEFHKTDNNLRVLEFWLEIYD